MWSQCRTEFWQMVNFEQNYFIAFDAETFYNLYTHSTYAFYWYKRNMILNSRRKEMTEVNCNINHFIENWLFISMVEIAIRSLNQISMILKLRLCHHCNGHLWYQHFSFNFYQRKTCFWFEFKDQIVFFSFLLKLSSALSLIKRVITRCILSDLSIRWLYVAQSLMFIWNIYIRYLSIQASKNRKKIDSNLEMGFEFSFKATKTDAFNASTTPHHDFSLHTRIWKRESQFRSNILENVMTFGSITNTK